MTVGKTLFTPLRELPSWFAYTTALSSAAVIALLFTTLPYAVAQGEFDISELRRELADLREQPSEREESFEERNALLEQKELQLLRQLEEVAPSVEEPVAREAARESFERVHLSPDDSSSSSATKTEGKPATVKAASVTEDFEVRARLAESTEPEKLAEEPEETTNAVALVADPSQQATTEANKQLESELEQARNARENALSRQRNLQSEVGKLQSRIRELETRNARLSSQLLLAETEVARLAEVLGQRPSTTASETQQTRSVAQHEQRPPRPQQSAGRANQRAPRDEGTMIATVTVAKANLRAGPGTNNAPIMQVSRGTRLLVETRQGGWYRVVSPNGSRAWISGDVIGFGAQPHRSPSGTINVSAVRGEGS